MVNYFFWQIFSIPARTSTQGSVQDQILWQQQQQQQQWQCANTHGPNGAVVHTSSSSVASK